LRSCLNNFVRLKNFAPQSANWNRVETFAQFCLQH
jgi:hypothetical protein